MQYPPDPAPQPSTGGGPPSRAPVEERAVLLLERMERRLARLEQRLDTLTERAGEASNLLATAVDAFDHAVEEPARLEASLRELGPTLQRLTRPETLRGIQKTVDLLQEAPLLIATLGDSVDDLFAQAEAQGVRLDQVAKGLREALLHFAGMLGSEKVSEAFGSGIFEEEVVGKLGTLAHALVESTQSPPPRVGMLSALGALRDPQVQATMGFMVRLASRFGGALQAPSASPRGDSPQTRFKE